MQKKSYRQFTRGCYFAVDVLAGAHAAWGTNVATGCAPYVVPSHHHEFYVDPLHGSMAGDGSQAHPWHTLAEVLDFRNGLVANAPPVFVAGTGFVRPRTNAPIKSGDVIYLLTGNHGNAFLQGNFGTNQRLSGYDNTDFITVTAAPGQTPIVKGLTLKGVGKWAFRGLTFQSLQDVPSNNGLPFSGLNPGTSDYYLVGMSGPNKNVLFDNDLFQSQADTSRWSVSDWLAKRVSGLTSIGGTCLSVTNNRLQNIGFAIASQRATRVLIQNNIINRFSDDGIDFGSSSMSIDHNMISNSINDGDGFHEDGMQGQPDGESPVTNIAITNNYVVNQTEPLISPSDLQGIDAFDGVWAGVQIENNVVVTNAYHGITFYGARDIWVVNNTVIGSNTAPGGASTWININPSKSGRPSDRVSVRNNISSMFAINATNASIDHNLVATMNADYIKYFRPTLAVSKAVPTTSVFQLFNHYRFRYDMRLRISPAVDSGGRALAPPVDIRGIARGSKIDLGAVAFGGPPINWSGPQP